MKKIFLAAAFLLPFSVHAQEPFSRKAYMRLAAECDKNKLDSCVTFAIWTRDYMEASDAARAPLEKACNGGNMKGCNVLGNLYLNPYGGLGEDADKARALYRKACKGGYANACTNLQSMDSKGAQTKHALSREERLQKLRNACVLENESACRALQAEPLR
ncbi:Beta-lactamase hcpA precursor [Kingella potus]|uniref:Beta-lactamase hcpA n=1 Tax=Kingella potus TaxID=265175 RepID=A0A377R1F8_9NEIS|nr:sel1 repeat family protein [Kingella potus]STR00151.1 Beta-lactamase hcpA precursor [Kingella potus]